jgi:hypothetical protein
MAALDPDFLRTFLESATAETCLAWYQGCGSDRVRARLRPLLFASGSDALHPLPQAVLREKLLELFQQEAAFRDFVCREATQKLDHSTAQYLDDLLADQS